MQKIGIGITGASGAVLGVRALDAFAAAGVETHLVVSKWGQQTLEHETALRLDDLRGRATCLYSSGDMSAAISSSARPWAPVRVNGSAASALPPSAPSPAMARPGRLR